MNNKKSDQRAGEKQKKKEILFRTNLFFIFLLVGFNTNKTGLTTKNRSKGREKME